MCQWTFLDCTFCCPISDHVMPSWEFSCIRQHLKETIPSSGIMWSAMGKQNIQAKEGYYCQLEAYLPEIYGQER